ncbi:MAG: M48 family metalloprotease [Bacteroidota bacterium]
MKAAFLILQPLLITLLLLLPSKPIYAQFYPSCAHAHHTVAPNNFYGGCQLNSNFEPVHHTGRRYLQYLVYRLAPGAGINPHEYAIDLIKDRRGIESINAMTCASSKVIWLSVKAYRELVDSEASLAFIMAHEIAHGVTLPQEINNLAWMNPQERQLYNSFSSYQRKEVLIDFYSAQIMLRAGYQDWQISAGARYILSRDGAEHLVATTYSHPGGWDRVRLLEGYLASNDQGFQRMVNVGRVLPR